jgi:hypothetical protein
MELSDKNYFQYGFYSMMATAIIGLAKYVYDNWHLTQQN